MLKAINLTKIYKSKKGKNEVKALKDVSVDFGDNGLVFLLGKSGSGKSTLLNLLGGIDKATSGEIIVNGRSSDGFSESDYDSYRNTNIGFVFQEYNLINEYSVDGNVALALELQSKKADKNEIDEILRKVELVDEDGQTLYHRLTGELSGGQKQRVAIARALIKKPKIILADEPTGALDSETGSGLYEILKKLSKEQLVIVVTHDRENAEKYGDRIIELKDGKIVDDKTLALTEISESHKTTAQKPSSEEVTFIKSKLPFKRCLAMGAQGLKHKVFRLCVSIFLSVVSFAAFGFFLTTLTVDTYNTELNTLQDNHRSIFAISSDNFNEAQIDEIKKYTGKDQLMKMSFPWDGIYISRYYGGQAVGYLNPYHDLAASFFQYVVELNPETGETDANLTADSRFIDKNLCRLPQNFNEIAITDLKMDMFIEFGYKAEDETVIPIKTPDDMIGKKLGNFTVCGVYSTEDDKSYLAQFDIDHYDLEKENLRASKLMFGARHSIISYGFVYEGYREYAHDVRTAQKILVKRSGNVTENRAFIDKLNELKDSDAADITITSQYSVCVGTFGFMDNEVGIGLLIGTIGISLFSALLMMNFLTVSIDFRKKELGILRALGARKKDVVGVCLAESLMIAAIDFVITIITLIITCACFNAFYAFVSILNFGLLQIGAVFLLCFGVAALATILPVMKLAKKKPIDIINGK